MSNRACSLVLAAHGSLAAENSNQPLHDLANSIANSFVSRSENQKFDVVRPAFLNGQPALSNVLETLPPGDVVVVPVMTSQGYYLQKLPGKLRENTNCDEFRFFMTPVIGVHPSIPRRIGRRISRLLSEFELAVSETTIVVIGHGTRRNDTSGQSTIQLTEKLAAQLDGLKFETAFLDQEPTVAEVAANIKTRHTLVIPFLISRGPHSTEDVPQAFGLSSGPDVRFPIVRQNDNGICICDFPVGMYPDMAEVCLELAAEAVSDGNSIQLSPTGELTS